MKYFGFINVSQAVNYFFVMISSRVRTPLDEMEDGEYINETLKK